MRRCVDWDLPIFDSLDAAMRWVAAGGGGIVVWPHLADLNMSTEYAKGILAKAKAMDVELRAAWPDGR